MHKESAPKIPMYPDGYKNMLVRTYKAHESGNGSTDMHSKAGLNTIAKYQVFNEKTDSKAREDKEVIRMEKMEKAGMKKDKRHMDMFEALTLVPEEIGPNLQS